jgi:multiple sugar transport system substrate-binding protein
VKKVKSALWICILAMLLTACNAGTNGVQNSTGEAQETTNSSGNASESKDKEPVALKMTFWAGAQRPVEIVEQVIELFNKKYPYITIETEYTGWNDYWEKLNIQAAGNDLPDIIRHDFTYIAQFAEKGLLRELDDLAEQKIINLDDVDQSLLTAGRINEKLYGVSVGSNALSFLYDPAVLAQAGVPAMSEDWTWEDYEKYMEQIASGTGVYGNGHLEYTVFQIYLRQHGARMFNDAGNGFAFDRKLLEDFYAMQVRLGKLKAITSIQEELEVKGMEDSLFVKGKQALAMYWSNQLIDLENLMGKELEIGLPPGSGNGKGLYIKPTHFITISKNSKHPEEAAMFIDFWINDIEANKIINAAHGIPVSSKVVEAIEGNFSSAQLKSAEYIKLATAHSAPIDPPDPSGASEIIKLWSNVGSELFYDKLDVTKAVEKFYSQGQKILERK